ncbi:MAG: penicillin-binding protein 2 [Armatimonadetes bacterium]|nr:penicillin-binding protein 2 [Armatimonadota bacterium]
MPTQAEDRKLQFARINQLAAMIALMFFILIGRLWFLQIALGDEMLEQSEANRIKLLRMRGPRGTILDRKGRVLATSRPQFVVMAIPDEVKANHESLRTLCGILQVSPEELDSIFQKSEGRPGSPVRVAVDVPMDIVARIGELRMMLPGVSVELDHIRYYPDGHAVAHIMGTLREISQEQLDEAEKSGKSYRPGDYVGKSGLEKQYEDDLRGEDGGKQIEVNAFGRVVRILGEKQPVPGKTLKLTIDRDLQVAAERAMGSQVGAAVAVDPRTGAVLAMVSKPSYDANIFVKRVKPADWKGIIGNKNKPLQNRAVYNVYPPGSTFKPMMAIAGLLYHECDANTTVSCPGSFYFGRTFRCWKVHGGGVNFQRAIAESCDVWFYKLALRLGIDRMAKVIRQFGISQATGIDLPNESRYKDHHVGTMPDTAWKRKVYHEKWYPGETPSCGIGQGYVEASPLQMALSAAGVANFGKIYRPHLLDEVITRDGRPVRRVRPGIVHQVNAPEEDFEMVRQAMRATVTNGTGGVCNIPGVAVCGKTGSAENRGAAHGWFIAFAPLEDPQIAVACIVEHGRHGASTAAPVCRAILDVYFGKKKPEEVGSGKTKVSGD